MAVGDVVRIIRAPGRLVVDPTQPFDGGTFPYGGTEIGFARMCILTPQGTGFRVHYESLGETGDILEPEHNYNFACFLRGWDDDAVQQMLTSGYEAGSVTQHSVFAVPGSVTPGQSALARAIKLVYVPDDPVHVPAALVYHGVPLWSEGAELAFQRQEELGIPLVVECLRNTNDNILRVGRLPDLSLT